MFAFIRDVRGDAGDPIQHGKHLEVALENTVHLGPTDDRTARRMIAYLLQRERGPQDILGELLPPLLVAAVNAHLVHVRRDPFAKLQDPLLVAGGTEIPTFAVRRAGPLPAPPGRE